MKLGITGPAYSGKTTLFALLSGISYETASVAQLSMSRHGSSGQTDQKSKSIGVKVPDSRLDLLVAREGPPDKLTPAVIDFYDTPGLKIPATKVDENAQSIAMVREADGIICVIKSEPADVPEPAQVLRQITDIKNELLIADLSVVEKRLDKLQQQVSRGGSTIEQDKKEIVHLTKMQTALEAGHSLEQFKSDPEANRLIKNYGILMIKPMVIIHNLPEAYLKPAIRDTLIKEITKQYPNYIALSLKLEYELNQPDFSPEERQTFLAGYNMSDLSTGQILTTCYRVLGLITFFTVGKDEIRGWTVKQNDNALAAAGVIHTDIARGFISAEVIPFQHWQDGGAFKNAKERGKLRLEGKSYIVQDGDIIHFKFNV